MKIELTKAEARTLKKLLDDLRACPGHRVADVMSEADFALAEYVSSLLDGHAPEGRRRWVRG